MTITDFPSGMHVVDEIESLSPELRHHAKIDATGLLAAPAEPHILLVTEEGVLEFAV